MARKMIRTTFMSMLVVVFLLSMVTTSYAASYAPPAGPVINYFETDSANVNVGDTVVLSWDVDNATSIEIIGLEKLPEDKLPLEGTMEVWPMDSTTYVLNAYGANGSMKSVSVDVNVGVSGDVEIKSFTAEKTELEPNESTTLSWKLLNAKSFEIIGLEKLPESVKQPEKEIPVTEGSLEIWPFASTAYVLQVTGFKGEIVSKTIMVTVLEDKVSIDSVKINPDEIELGQKATISWETTNAEKVSIDGVSNNLPADGTVQVKPDKSGTINYKVVAIGKNGDKATKSVNLVVKQTQKEVKIISFDADKMEVSRGTLVKFTWATENADGCMLVTSDGLKLTNRPANGLIRITPNKTRDYTLIAYSGDQQNTVEKTITIKVK